jgi:hypothetical protein
VEYSRLVVGYHGCDHEVAERVLNGEPFRASENEWDWLGKGIYFWEYGPERAYEFALEQRRRKKVDRPAVIGALINLGTCFDLLDARYPALIKDAYPTFETQLGHQKGRSLPQNKGGSPTRKGRYLDCAVLNWYLTLMDKRNAPFQTVRAVFVEGDPPYPGAGFYLHSHIQIAIRDPSCIIGVFRPTAKKSKR